MARQLFSDSLVKKILGHSNATDVLRDMSLVLKGRDNELAFKLISLAHAQRPAGPAIKKIRSRIVEDLYTSESLQAKQFYVDALGDRSLTGEAVDALLPGLGFFDASPIGALRVEVKRKITSLKIVTASPRDEFMNLRHLKIFSENGKNLANERGVKLKESCSTSRDVSCGSLLRGEGHHSRKEKMPHYMVEFDSPLYVGWLEIGNREDYQGIRSRYLLVETEGEDGISQVDYATTSQANVNRIISTLHDFLGDDFTEFFESVNESESISYRLQHLWLLRKIYDALELRYSEVDAATWWCVLQCLDVWGKHANQEAKAIEREIVSCYVARLFIERHRKLPKSFEKLFPSKSAVSCLETSVNVHLNGREIGDVMLTKHGLSGKGKLVNNVENCLQALTRVFGHLEEMGFQPLLAYGTLLGAVRENAFLDHDDDIDIIFLGGAECREEAEKEVERIVKYFGGLEGYRVGDGVNKHLNRHVIDKELGVMIDVFPVWRSEQLAYLHMEKMGIRGIDSSIFEGVSQAYLYDRPFAAPANSRHFLVERYGDGWGTPDKFHEWPWVLEG